MRGKWRIVEMDLWDAEAIDLLGPAFIEFHGKTGSFRFIAVECSMDVRSPAELAKHDAEFSFEGFDDCDPTTGRVGFHRRGRIAHWKDLLSHGRRIRLPGGSCEAMRASIAID